MPTSVASLILLVVLVFPGVAYVWRREHDLPERRLSAFRETTTVVVSGVVANFAAAWVLLVPAVVWPQLRPEIGLVTGDLRGHTAGEYVRLLGWGTSLVVVATLLAAAFASLIRKVPPRPSIVSSWWLLFRDRRAKMQKEHKRGDLKINAACFLDDGSVIEGEVIDFNDHSEETGDRDLILRAPIRRTTPTGETQHLASEIITVSARNMTALSVAYLFPEVPEPPPDGDDGVGELEDEGGS